MSTTHWGLGLVANDGGQKLDFGTTDYGDRVFRTSIAGKLADDWAFYIAGDWVIEDDLGSWSEGQRAIQGTLGVQWLPTETNKMGFLGVYRDQVEADQISGFSGFLLDVFATTTQIFKDFEITTGFEGAYMHGVTTRFTNRNNPNGLGIRSFGALSKTTISYRKKARISFDGGFASGDGDPSDETLSSFAFDRDCNAGALLFDYHQAAREVALHNLLTDPEHSGQPPDGVDSLVTEGAIRQALYVNPILGYRPLPWLEVKLGSLFAWSTVPISQGFETYRNGGVAVNHLGERTEGYFMGAEVNWAVTVHRDFAKTTAGHLMLEGAHLAPSIDLGGGPPLHLFRIKTIFGW